MAPDRLSQLHLSRLQQCLERLESVADLLLLANTPEQYASIALKLEQLSQELTSIHAELMIVYTLQSSRPYSAGQ